MKTTHFFSYFCSVQHRLDLSPQAAALFFFILGELSATDFKSNSLALTNSRIVGTIRTSHAALRKCREQLIAAHIISFTSTDNGKSLSLYTLQDTDTWLLDVVATPTPATKKTKKTTEVQPKPVISELSDTSEAL